LSSFSRRSSCDGDTRLDRPVAFGAENAATLHAEAGNQLWLLQRTVEPLMEAIGSSAADADHWQDIIAGLRSVYGPALFAESA
jgi:hypothetical protein